MIRPYNNNKAQERSNKNWHCIKYIVRKDYITRVFGYQIPNNGVLASHCHERFYTLGADVDRRRGMNRGRERDNGHKQRVFLLKMFRLKMYSLESFEYLGWCVGIGILVCRLCLSLLLPTPFIGLKQLTFHANFALSTPLGFHMGLLRTKLEFSCLARVRAKWAIQFFQFLHQFSSKALEIFFF